MKQAETRSTFWTIKILCESTVVHMFVYSFMEDRRMSMVRKNKRRRRGGGGGGGGGG
jgi:hypothetical protein